MSEINSEKPRGRRKWTNFGSVLLKKDGKGTYIKIKKNISLKEGQVVFVQDPRLNPNFSEEVKAKIPAYVKFDLVLVEDQE